MWHERDWKKRGSKCEGKRHLRTAHEAHQSVTSAMRGSRSLPDRERLLEAHQDMLVCALQTSWRWVNGARSGLRCVSLVTGKRRWQCKEPPSCAGGMPGHMRLTLAASIHLGGRHD